MSRKRSSDWENLGRTAAGFCEVCGADASYSMQAEHRESHGFYFLSACSDCSRVARPKDVEDMLIRRLRAGVRLARRGVPG